MYSIVEFENCVVFVFYCIMTIILMIVIIFGLCIICYVFSACTLYKNNLLNEYCFFCIPMHRVVEIVFGIAANYWLL